MIQHPGARSLIPSLAAIVGLAACDGRERNGELAQDVEGVGLIDADNDGVFADEDCDDNNPTVLGAVPWYSDGDNDGYGGADSDVFLSCTQPTGAASNNLDCDDTTAATRPDADEICDSRDNDCDGLVDDDDDDVVGRVDAYADTDLDGYGDPDSPVEACELGAGAETVAGDCDDTRADVNPDAEEICQNGLDDDCDGMSDTCQWDAVADLGDMANVWSGLDGDFAGAAIARAEDATGDGLPDLLVGMPYSDLHTYDGGAVAVLSGPTAVGGGRLADGQVDAILLGTEQSGYNGSAVTAADFDGDGYSDIVTGAPEASTYIGASGQVSVFYGPVDGVIRVPDADTNFTGSRLGDRAGRSLSAVGDVSGDGVVDLIIGSGASSANDAPVAAWIVSDPASAIDLASAPALVIDPLDRPRDHLVTTADLNGDGIEDLVIGSPDSGDADSPAGAVYIHLGPFTESQHLVQQADAAWTGSPGHAVGTAVLTGHDFNGDGSIDLVVGAPGAASDSGEVTLITAPLTGGALLSESTRWRGTQSSSAGAAISTVAVSGGRVLLIGGPGADSAELDGGAVWVVPAASDAGIVGLEEVAVARFDGTRTSLAGEAAGSALLGVGDLDGDSYEDVAIGAPLNGEGGVAAGAIHVIRGQGM
jgi:hypothetical protein